MQALVLDVSTERGVIAVFNDQEKIFEEQLPYGFQNSHFALPELQKKMDSNLFKLADLNYIGVGVGPGSYTGIRVGAAIAKSLAFVLEIPLIGICTLDALIPNEEGNFAAIIDAKIGGVYLQTGGSGPKACSLPEAVGLLKDIPLIVTPNAGQIRPKLEKIFPENRWNWEEVYPRAERLKQTAEEKMKSGTFSMDCKLDLLYMRKTQAEIEREKIQPSRTRYG